ncbi:hypothetical protein [uncultured phage cr56_1]|jgi:hypothetical protein|uniref:Uncharacterized protein n=1 Tax=uncultured phage cr56_1 TaxID=2772081 RepID=A0A7M1RSD6_9CAUD|nr:hypothetical protein KNV48_gp25 [uncultured phage cr56_1]QOR56831.1 hypothetical protein [uncultured phage cr56_1]DAP92676.1 MAG TPA: hypothetical protein [Caudoviricetes sp.]DAU41388.1 MAG TPA: hypothetical protein [Bacteriophage sp.]
MEKVIYIDKRQAEYTTKIATESRNENKNAKLSKKERIKQILKEAGYDPTIKYTSKEKRKFTRIVKNKLFEKPKPVTLTKEQIKERIRIKQGLREQLLKERKHISEFVNKKIQKGYTAAELSVKEKTDIRTFQYVVQKKSEDNPQRDYDFLTDYFKASSREDAKNKAMKIAKKYADNDDVTGIRIQDSKDNNIIYYTKSKLLAA